MIVQIQNDTRGAGRAFIAPECTSCICSGIVCFPTCQSLEIYKTAKTSFVAYPGIISLKCIEQIYNYLNMNVLVLGLEGSGQGLGLGC